MANKLTFSEAMEKLNSIVEKLDDSSLPLEQSLALFEEGLTLSKQCQQELKQFENRINKIILENIEEN
ncbi:MAG: exodeoxyribonuclease VII small subunit [Erysipelothrix sp.]|nr:exodeoxyribonuclease VII small subunit [Erysipelothrix sp.]